MTSNCGSLLVHWLTRLHSVLDCYIVCDKHHAGQRPYARTDRLQWPLDNLTACSILLMLCVLAIISIALILPCQVWLQQIHRHYFYFPQSKDGCT